MKTKRRKILQHGKRTTLNIFMYTYRLKINDYEQQYQQALNELELNFTFTQQLTKYCNRASPKAMLDRYAELLENRLSLRFMARLSFTDQMRAQREYDLVKSIRRKLGKGQLILRVCDKSGGLHLSTKSDYE
ncbi:unnamed protein product [Rotaria sordida]|uniref:Uncharacterized protein n=1 Tax=Rotaria sordida TaxID=392033 RepID=A0A815SXH3_9BILA|nr:unnamed protein product [Rotaria sordida]